MELFSIDTLFRLAIKVENLITEKLKLIDYGCVIKKEEGYFIVTSLEDPKLPGEKTFPDHFCVTVGLNPKTNQPCIFLFNVKNRPLVNQLTPSLIGRFGENIVFDLDDQEYSPELVQQIFEKRD